MKVYQTQELQSFEPAQLPLLRKTLREMIAALNANPYTLVEDVEVTTPATPNTDFVVTLKTLRAVPTTYQIVRLMFPRPGGGPAAGAPAALLAQDGTPFVPAPILYDAPSSDKTRSSAGKAWLRCSVGGVRMTIRFT